jgi:hypothetical protein
MDLRAKSSPMVISTSSGVLFGDHQPVKPDYIQGCYSACANKSECDCSSINLVLKNLLIKTLLHNNVQTAAGKA